MYSNASKIIIILVANTFILIYICCIENICIYLLDTLATYILYTCAIYYIINAEDAALYKYFNYFKMKLYLIKTI